MKKRPIKRVTKAATVRTPKSKPTKRFVPKRQGKIVIKKKKK
jgi:hypothetical protein